MHYCVHLQRFDSGNPAGIKSPRPLIALFGTGKPPSNFMFFMWNLDFVFGKRPIKRLFQTHLEVAVWVVEEFLSFVEFS